MFQLSIFDDDDKRMTEMDDRCKDYRRLGSFFKPWYWDIKSYALLNHIDMDALENMCSNINWIHYDNFISDNGVNKIDIKNWFAHYISHIVLNEYIKNDNIYQDVKSYRKFKKDEFSYQLKENDIILTDILKEYCDDLIRNDISVNIYITESDYDKQLVLHLSIKHPNFDPISIKFNSLNKK